MNFLMQGSSHGIGMNSLEIIFNNVHTISTFVFGQASIPSVLTAASWTFVLHGLSTAGALEEVQPADSAAWELQRISSQESVSQARKTGAHTCLHLSGGQRNFMGKYCLHFHHAGVCPDCTFKGNAVYQLLSCTACSRMQSCRLSFPHPVKVPL